MKKIPRDLRLSSRDYEALEALGEYRFLSARGLAHLHFPSEDSALRRLRELRDHGLVHRMQVPVRSSPNTPSAVWALKGRGARYVASKRGGQAPPYLTAREERTGHFLEHTLARNDFRIVLERLSQLHPKFTLLSWRQEKRDVLRSAIVETRGRPRRVVFVPDGVAIVRVGGECQALAVEIDRATVKPKHMAVRYQAYWRYWRDGGARRDYGPIPFRVLTVTTDERHARVLEEVARKAPDGRIGTKVFWFATQGGVVDPAQPELLLDAVWSVACRNRMSGQALFAGGLLN